MIRYVLCSKVGAVTGRAIAAEIAARQGRRCLVRFKTNPFGRCVRWGSHVESDNVCLNTDTAIKLASNKLKALQAMKAVGVRVPTIITPQNALSMSSFEHQTIWRKNNRHGGNDQPKITASCHTITEDEVSGYDYGLRFIKKVAEYRVHVFLGKVIRLQKKAPVSVGVGADTNPIWSHDNGWHLNEISFHQDLILSRIGIKAVESLGLDFGAVDIIKGRCGNHYVLEVNTAPGLTERGVACYVDHIIDWDVV